MKADAAGQLLTPPASVPTAQLLAAVLLLLASCSGHAGMAPGAGTPDRVISDHPIVTILPDTYVAGGQAASIVATERPANGELLLDINVTGAKVLKAIFFPLEFDPAKYSVGKLDSKH